MKIEKSRAVPTVYVVGAGAFHFLTIDILGVSIRGTTEMLSLATSVVATSPSVCCNLVGATISNT